jgi:hypothetical protein
MFRHETPKRILIKMFSRSSSTTAAEVRLERQRKQCGHDCFPSTTLHRCPCSDLRPHRVGNTYPVYVDGVGWCDTGSRDEGYCPVCNPKNYDVWIEKIEIQHKEKQKQKEQLQKLLEERNIHANEDMLHIYSEIGDKKGKFLYTNGDEYDGDFLSGQRHGYGVMIYASDNSIYDGEWKHNKQDGYGTKNWGDGIAYEGEWKDDMMHGKGRYTLSCGTVIEGRFECDEFAE